jgi:filamentous hemagglutinin family protein
MPVGYAEVTLDGSVGTSDISPGDSVPAGNGFTYNITSDFGEQAGENLFHSFDRFNIHLGEHANFSGPTSVSNIVSRVTGGESSIAGKITSSISGASLWLVNPAGFIFSNGAVVDVDGTLHLSTGDFLEFSDGSRYFSNPSALSTLSTSAISSFGFLADSGGTINIDSSRAPDGEVDATSHNLNINAQAITVRNADLNAQEIGIRTGDASFGNIYLENSLLETVGGGTVKLAATAITLDNVEVLGEAIGTGTGGDILFEATTVSISNDSTINVSSLSTIDDAGDSGAVRITAETVDIANTEFLLAT